MAEAREALIWSQGWLAAVVLMAVLLILSFGYLPWGVVGAVVAMFVPPLATLVLRSRDSARLRGALVVFWAIGGASACIFGGGLSGPLAAWCLAPVAAATALGAGRVVAEAAALSIMAIAVAGFTQVMGAAPPPPPEAFTPWLGLTALLTTSVGLGAGFLLAHRRAGRRRSADLAAYAVLERLLTEQPHLVLSLDSKGLVGSAFGYAPEGVSEGLLLGEGLLAAAEPNDRAGLLAAFQTAQTRGQAEGHFSPVGALHCTCTVVIRRSGDGGLVAVLRDASRDRAREAALEAAKLEAEQLNTGKSRFLANMSHELRTPLNAIMGFSDIMRSRLFGPLTGKYGEYAELIHESGGHLLDLINDVLDMSKIEAERYELQINTFDVREPVSAALRLLRLQADDAGISLRGVLPARDIEVDADSRAIKQIVLNLVSNALKFTPKGGTVTVTLSEFAGRVELAVADTGVGIAEDDLKRLGRPFEQAGDAGQRAKGAGLGLSLVRAFAELHGGEMVIESELGEGTSVTVRLPILHQADRPTAQVIAFAPPAR
jgi:two-component system, cell cycle sensor histidine kinase DivJ